MKRLDMRIIKEILRLKFDNKLSNRNIAKSLNISKGAVNNYLQQCISENISWPLSENDETVLLNLLYNNKENVTSFKNNYADINCEYIFKELKKKGVTLLLLWEEYCQNNPLNYYSRSHFCSVYKNWSRKSSVVMRQQHKAGDKLFIDYAGDRVPIIDPNTGESRKAEIFVAVLGASTYTYAEATLTQSLPDWIGSHIRTFEFLGGVPCLLVPDNLRSGITKACRYEPLVNASYAELARHYNTAILPARPVKPRDKAKVENAVLIISRRILAKLRNRQFFSLYELNQEISKLLPLINNEAFQKNPEHCRRSLFEEIDKPALKPLPLLKFEYVEFKNAKVNIDYHIEYKKHYYSVPYVLVGKTMEVKATNNIIEIFYNHKKVAVHIRNNKCGSHTTADEHMPTKHQKHLEWSSDRFLNWAVQIGPETVNLVKNIFQKKQHPEQGYRACLGLLNLAKKFGGNRLEVASGIANKLKSYKRSTVLSILENNADLVNQEDDKKEGNNIIHENIRGSDYFNKK
jgi:transposase